MAGGAKPLIRKGNALAAGKGRVNALPAARMAETDR
jgi:hypothetical protein